MQEFIKYFYELGMLKRLKRTGYYAAGIKDPESIAEHTYRTIAITYFIAKLEKADAERAVLLALFHDNVETRIGDTNKIAAKYMDYKKSEDKVWEDQVKNFPPNIKNDLQSVFTEIKENETKEAIIAKDADLLECAIQSKEYLDIGYKSMQDWIDNTKKRLKTATAKKMIRVMEKTPSESWWEGIKKIYLDEVV